MRTKSMILLAITLMGLIGLSSCEKINGKGEVVTEYRTVTGFAGIDLAIDGKVYYTQGPDYSLMVEAQENLMRYIQTFVDDGRLVIREKPGMSLGKHEPIIFRITAPSVSGIWISGSGNFYVLNTWTGENLEAGISGSGKISITSLDTRSIQVRISGSGDLTVSGGFADSEHLQISGSGNVDLRQVISIYTSATISGSGDIYTQVSDLLDATIAGSGSIYYLGQPVIKAHISGSGKVVKL